MLYVFDNSTLQLPCTVLILVRLQCKSDGHASHTTTKQTIYVTFRKEEICGLKITAFDSPTAQKWHQENVGITNGPLFLTYNHNFKYSVILQQGDKGHENTLSWACRYLPAGNDPSHLLPLSVNGWTMWLRPPIEIIQRQPVYATPRYICCKAYFMAPSVPGLPAPAQQ